MSLSTGNDCCCDRRPAAKTSPGGAFGISSHEPVPVKTRIMFVDDEPAPLRVLKMGMRSMTGSWDMEFANNGEEALALIGQKKFDVVVTDMRMPGVNGAQLLNHILRLHPQTVRIVLSGYTELSEVVNCVGLTHQFLQKPCSLDDIKNCLKRVTLVKSRLTQPKLCELTAGLQNLPSLPELYLEIADALQSPTASAQLIADIASKDPALCAKLLQLANSAYFGFSRKVFTVAEAVQLLGVSVIQSLAMAVPLFSAFNRNKCPDFPIDLIWNHSAQTGSLGSRIFKTHLAGSPLAEHAFCAGVLHDIGKIILADGLPGEYAAVLKEARATGAPLAEVERKYFHATHAEVGAYLLALWGLPMPLVEAVACHHHPQRCDLNELCLAGIVHIANSLQHAQSVHPDMVASPVDNDYLNDYLKQIGFEQQFEIWRAELTAGNG